MQEGELDYSVVTQKLHVPAATVKNLEQQKILSVEVSKEYRNPVSHLKTAGYH